jgi:short-subunit dehydrogenase
MHVAGTVDLGPVAQLSATSWLHQLTVNLVAPAELTRLLLPQLRAGRGRVVFVNSGAGLNARPDWAAYAASKHGLKALADSLRQEEHANGVRVTSIYPGRTATPMQEKVHRQEGRAYLPDAFTTADSIATAILLALDLPPDGDVTDLTVRPGG